MKRNFEKISFEQFSKDVCDDVSVYSEYSLPKRKTKNAAGYDFFAINDFVLKPGEIIKIPTGVKSYMGDNEVLLLIDRSSMGFKHNVRLCNQVGVIDADYYNNSDNEGHIWIRLQNEGDKDFVVKKGDGIIQGMFVEFLTVDNENTDFLDRKSDY